jgi:hypothetical protein
MDEILKRKTRAERETALDQAIRWQNWLLASADCLDCRHSCRLARFHLIHLGLRYSRSVGP